jgi:hypothetical protein
LKGRVHTLNFALQVIFQAHKVTIFVFTIAPVFRPAINLKGNEDAKNYNDYFQGRRAVVRLGEILSQSFKHPWVPSLGFEIGNRRAALGH